MEKKIDTSLTKNIPPHELTKVLKENSKRDLLEALLQWKMVASQFESQLKETKEKLHELIEYKNRVEEKYNPDA